MDLSLVTLSPSFTNFFHPSHAGVIAALVSLKYRRASSTPPAPSSSVVILIIETLSPPHPCYPEMAYRAFPFELDGKQIVSGFI